MMINWRQAFIFGLIITGSAVLAATEILNVFHALGFWEILCFWVLLGFSFGVVLKKKIVQITWHDHTLTFPDIVLLIFILFIVAICGLTSFWNPPNTWDSLTYHIARVAHWAQNRSVDFYPSHVGRQVVSSPWLEYLALHFQILFKGDYLANAIQWMSMIGCLIGTSLIAGELGLPVFWQLFSALLTATLPLGILESSSMQGDYAVALWIVSASYLLISRKNFSWGSIILFALSLGLASLTKGTGIIFALPLVAGFLFKIRFNLKKLLVLASIIILMNSGFLIRTHQLAPNNMLIACQVHSSIMIEPKDISLDGTVANILRNIGMHLGSTDPKLNAQTENKLYQLSSWLHIDLNKPVASRDNSQIHLSAPSRDENFVTNPWHTVLYLLITILLVLCFRRKQPLIYLSYIAGMLVLFSALVPWQPWSNRFHLGLFVLFAPLAAYVCQRFRFKIIGIILSLLFVSLALPYLGNGHPRQLSGRGSFFYKSRGINLLAYSGTTNTLPYSDVKHWLDEKNCRQIGLIIGLDDWDYPFYYFFNPHQDPSIRIEHVLVDNLTKNLAYPLGDFSPCVIIAHTDQTSLNVANRIYTFDHAVIDLKIFTPEKSS